MRTRWAVAACLLGGAIVTSPGMRVIAQEPALDAVLARATQYAVDYPQALSGVVSEESYVQTYRRGARMPEVRTLRSDVLLTRPPGGARFLFFRDVFDVDGRQVRDRDERLLQLFLSPTASTSLQVVRILAESARHNIGDIPRTINTPTLALVFLDPQYRARFRFERAADRVAETVRGLSVDEEANVPRFTPPEDVWVVAYQEIGLDSLIVSGAGGNLHVSGRYWIEPATGRIVMTEMQLGNPALTALVDVRYDLEPGRRVLRARGDARTLP